MAEQQLIDYLKKARGAGQADDQTRNLLYKNGWTEAEVKDAFDVVGQPQAQPQFKPQPQPQQPQSQPQNINQNRIEIKTQSMRQPEGQTATPASAKPQAKPQPTFVGPQDNMPKMKSRSHLLPKLLVSLLVIAVLAGAGVFFAGQYFNFPWNSFGNPNPETVLNNMLSNMRDIKIYHTTAKLEISATDKNKISQGKASVDINSERDVTDASNPKLSGNFVVNITAPDFGSSTAAFSVAAIVVGDTSYFKLNSITLPNGALYPGLNVSEVNGRWLEFDSDSLQILSPEFYSGLQAMNVPQASESDLDKKVLDLLATEGMLYVDKQLNDETISSQRTYHYLVKINKEKLIDFVSEAILPEFKKAMETQGSANGSASLLAENMGRAAVTTVVSSLGDISAEMWIGQKDFLLYKIKVDKVVDLDKILSDAGVNLPSASSQIGIKIDMTNSNFNKPITVQAPADAQKIENVLLPLVKTQRIKMDMGQIASIANMASAGAQNYSSLCSYGLLNGYLATYGTNLLSLNGDIVKQGAKKPACFSSLTGYCVSTQLADGSYICISSAGSIGTTKCVSAQTGCQ